MYDDFAVYVPFRSDQMLLGCCGFHGDVLTVTKNVETQMKVHVNNSRKFVCVWLVHKFYCLFSR